MDFFQSIMTFNKELPHRLSRAEAGLAASLQSKACLLAAKAAEEMNNGRTTFDLALEATDQEKARIFAEITVWHTQRAAEKYRQAAAHLAESEKIQTGNRKALSQSAKKMLRRAAEAQAALSQINEFLTRNQSMENLKNEPTK